MTPKQHQLVMAVAGRQAERIRGREEDVMARAMICGRCAFTQAMEEVRIGSQPVTIYRCTGKFCLKALDLKISLVSECCPRSKWS